MRVCVDDYECGGVARACCVSEAGRGARLAWVLLVAVSADLGRVSPKFARDDAGERRIVLFTRREERTARVCGAVSTSSAWQRIEAKGMRSPEEEQRSTQLGIGSGTVAARCVIVFVCVTPAAAPRNTSVRCRWLRVMLAHLRGTLFVNNVQKKKKTTDTISWDFGRKPQVVVVVVVCLCKRDACSTRQNVLTAIGP